VETPSWEAWLHDVTTSNVLDESLQQNLRAKKIVLLAVILIKLFTAIGSTVVSAGGLTELE